jgi:hypothetical protein
VGEPFEIAGFKVVYVDIYGDGEDITNKIELKVNNVKIYDGYKFTQAGEKTVDCYYEGKLKNSFKISVIPNDESLLETGYYYLQINSKYIYPVSAGWYWLELSDQKPEKPFYIELVRVTDRDGPKYNITYEGESFVQYGNKNGEQLRSGSTYYWRIDKHDNYISIRDYNTQKLLVNASGAKYDNKTKITVWSYPDSVPAHAKITFIKAD